jgi:hypothetical protein
MLVTFGVLASGRGLSRTHGCKFTLRLHHIFNYYYLVASRLFHWHTSAFSSLPAPWSPVRHSPQRERQGLHHCFKSLTQSLWNLSSEGESAILRKLRYSVQYIPVGFVLLRLHYTLSCPYVFKNGSEFDLVLSAYSDYSSSLPWSPVQHSPRGRQGLHHCLLYLCQIGCHRWFSTKRCFGPG